MAPPRGPHKEYILQIIAEIAISGFQMTFIEISKRRLLIISEVLKSETGLGFLASHKIHFD